MQSYKTNDAGAPPSAAQQDLGPLAWVLQELRNSLDDAVKSLRRFVRDAQEARGSDLAALDTSSLRVTRQQLHQACGVLEMVNMDGPATIVKAMEAAAQRLLQRPDLCSGEAIDTVEKACFALLEYLEVVLAGQDVPVVALFAQYSKVQQLAGNTGVHPADLWPVSTAQAHEPADAIPGLAAVDCNVQTRSTLDTDTLLLMKTGDTGAARQLSALALALARGQSDRGERNFWKIAAGLFEAIAAGLLPVDVFVKRVLSRILLHYATMSRGDGDISARLLREMLFFCDRAAIPDGVQAPALGAVRDACGLHGDGSLDYSILHFGLVSPVVLGQARNRVKAAMDAWSQFTAGDGSRVKSVSDQFSLLSESLLRIYPGTRELAEALKAAAARCIRARSVPDAVFGVEVATAILYIQAALDERRRPDDPEFAQRMKELARRLHRVVNGEAPGELEPWMEEVYQQVSGRRDMGSVVTELGHSLGEVEKVLDDFFRNPSALDSLPLVSDHLRTMRGVFSVLDLDQATATIDRVLQDAEAIRQGSSGLQQQALFDRMGVNIGALGFMVDMLAYQPGMAATRFVFDASSGELKNVLSGAVDETPSALQTLQPDVDTAISSSAGEAQEISSGAAAASASPRKMASGDSSGDEVLSEEDAELREIFLEEAREVVGNGLAAAGVLQATPDNMTAQTDLRRAFHTLKGSSRMVGLTEYGEAAWAMEQMLNAWLAEQKPMGSEMLGLAADALDGLGLWADAIAENRPRAWSAQPFIVSADAMRLEGRLVSLHFGADAGHDAREVAKPQKTGREPPAASESAADRPSRLQPVFEDAAHALREAFQQHDAAIGEDDASASTSPAGLTQEAVDAWLPTDVAPLADLAGTPVRREETPDVAEDAPAAADSHAMTEPMVLEQSWEDAHTQPWLPTDIGGIDTVPAGLDLALSLDHGAAEQGAPLLNIDFSQAQDFVVDEPSGVDAAEAGEQGAGDGLDFDLGAFGEEAQVLEVVDASGLAEDVLTGQDAPFVDVDDSDAIFSGDGAEPSSSGMGGLEVVEADAPVLVDEPPVLEQEDDEAEIREDEFIKVIGPLRISLPLYNVYLGEADEWSRVLQVAMSEWELEPHVPLPDTAVAMAHSLAGTSGTIGFTALADLARLFEQAMQRVQLRPPEQSRKVAKIFVMAADEIRKLLHNFAAGFLKEPSLAVLLALREIGNPGDMPADGGRPLDAPDLQPTAPSEPAPLSPAPSASLQEVSASGVADEPQQTPQQQADDQASLFLGREIAVADAIDPDLFPIFEEEATELIPSISASFREWTRRPDDGKLRDTVRRALHTLKGGARLSGAMHMGEMAHLLESAIESLDSEGSQTVEGVQDLLHWFDVLQKHFSALQRAGEKAVQQYAIAPQPARERAGAAAGDEASAQPVTRAPMPVVASTRQTSQQLVRVRAPVLDRMVNEIGEAMIFRSRLDTRISQARKSVADMAASLSRLRQQLRDIELQSESQMQSRQAQAGKDHAADFDPLEFDRFTRVQELTRMMAESVDDVATVKDNLLRAMEGAEDDLVAQGRQMVDLQHDLLRTRMVEFDSVSERLYAVVRQACKETGKLVHLEIAGGHVEVDRGVLDRLVPAFEHLLRNAVVHGIEDAEGRRKAGKKSEGTVTIMVAQDGNDVRISLRDDGRGLDLKAIRMKAVEKGLIQALDVLDDEAVAELVFKAGLSTADAVSGLAGRGVGMDVVRTEVQSLGGTVRVSATSSGGTTFTMLLPLTTAVSKVVILRAGQTSIGVPVMLIEMVRRLPVAELEEVSRRGYLTVDGEEVPFYWCGALLQSSLRSTETGAKAASVVIIRSASQRVALHVDEVLGNQNVVVKNLGPQLARLPGLAGMSVLPSGAVVLIYNPVALAAVYGNLVRQISQQAETAWKDAPAGEKAEPGAAQGHVPDVLAPLLPDVSLFESQVPLVMVVDDSITVRRVTQRILRREGYRVVLANDGLHALEVLQQERPVVALCDIEMPRMDGFDLLRNIRADEHLKDLPVVMITSRAAEKHREHAMALGANHYLGKPYSEEDLLGIISAYAAPEKIQTPSG